MKKRAVFLVVLLILLFSGCSNLKRFNPPLPVNNEENISSKPLQTATPNNIESFPTPETGQSTPDADTTEENDIALLIPEGWHILERIPGEPSKAIGDLNKDEIDDVAVVIEENNDGDLSARRSLLIAFGNPDKTLTLSILAENAIMRANEGGGWGDPFEYISIDRGSIVLNFFGGSSQRWFYIYQFRYQDNGWYLIGATLGATVEVGEFIDFDEEDYNLLTGDYIIKKYDENGKQQITEGNRGKRKLVNLKEFDVNAESTF